MITVRGLTKLYGRHVAVKDLSFTVEPGEVVGFLGPNGAGKTTTMNIIAGVLSATRGSVAVDGHDVLEEPLEVKRKIGYLPEQPPLYSEMTVWQYLAFVAGIKKVEAAVKKESLERILAHTRIEEMRGRRIRNLSKGYRQRVGLAQALVGDPPVLILDEPTIGLDPKQVVEIRDLIRRLGEGHTVILSSHILPEVAAVCSRVIIIHKGAIVASDSLENLTRGLSGGSRVTARIEGCDPREVLPRIRSLPDVQRAEDLGSLEVGTFDISAEAHGNRDIRRTVSQALVQSGCTILTMKSMDRTLEEVFLQLITEES